MTRGWERALIAAAAVVLWGVVGRPMALGAMEGARVQQARAPAGWEVRQRLARLPATAAPDATLRALLARVAYDAALEDEDQLWSRRVARLLSDDERARAASLVVRDRPTSPPPPEAPFVDGDIVALARTLLDVYGYVETPVPPATEIDRWPGVDRQSRARGIEALAREHGLAPETAHAILAATIAFLDAQTVRGQNEQAMEPLLDAVSAAGAPAGGQ